MNIFRQLAEGGAFNFPTLLHIRDIANNRNFYFVNDNTNFVHNGTTYQASSFSFSGQTDDDSVLEIEIVENNLLINLLEENLSFVIDTVGVFNGEEVEEFTPLSFNYGSATCDGKKLSLTLSKDDRMNMTFPALIFTNYNNRGNS